MGFCSSCFVRVGLWFAVAYDLWGAVVCLDCDCVASVDLEF